MTAPGWKAMSHTQRRMVGMKRCCVALGHDRTARGEAPIGERSHAAKKGDRCMNWVSAAEIRRLGLPICSVHVDVWLENTKRDQEMRDRLRAKYDPGPLPLDGD